MKTYNRYRSLQKRVAALHISPYRMMGYIANALVRQNMGAVLPEEIEAQVITWMMQLKNVIASGEIVMDKKVGEIILDYIRRDLHRSGRHKEINEEKLFNKIRTDLIEMMNIVTILSPFSAFVQYMSAGEQLDDMKLLNLIVLWARVRRGGDYDFDGISKYIESVGWRDKIWERLGYALSDDPDFFNAWCGSDQKNEDILGNKIFG